MAGIAQADELNQACSAKAAEAICNKPGISYARVFAERGPRSAQEKEAYGKMVTEYGEGRASSLQAICWFLHWGSFTGNTLNGICGFKEGKAGTSMIFKATFLSYYWFLFYVVINVVGLLIKPLPKVPKPLSAGFGFVLAAIAGSFFFPLGVIGKIIGADVPKVD